MLPPLLKKTAFAAAMIYCGAMPVSFLVGGYLFSRPLRTPYQNQDLADAVLPDWDRSFLALMRDVEIELRPRVRLRGTVFASGSYSTVIILHRAGENRVEGIRAAYQLWNSGLDVLLLDRAAHGRSDGDTRPLFGGETGELKAVVDAVIQNGWSGTSKIGILGIGDAGTSALVAAAADRRIDAVCAEDPALRATDFVRASIGRWAPLPDLLLAPPTFLAVYGMRAAVDVEATEFDATEPISKLAVPVMVLSIDGSTRVAAREVYTKIPFGFGTFEEGNDRASVYTAMCRFFEQGL